MIIKQKTVGSLLVIISVLLIISLVLIKSDVDIQATLFCEVFHEAQPGEPICPAHQNNSSWILTIAFGVSFLLLGLGAYVMLIQREPPAEGGRSSFKPIDISSLNDDEKMVYELLKKKGGSAYQSDIIRETGYSKVKISRILDRLETLQAIERKRRGMTNIIVLT